MRSPLKKPIRRPAIVEPLIRSVGAAPPPTPATPVIYQAPTLSPAGSVEEGATITLGRAVVGGYPQPGLAYELRRGATPISTQAGGIYIPGTADVGQVLTYHVDASNTEGNVAAASNGVTVTAATTTPFTWANAATTWDQATMVWDTETI